MSSIQASGRITADYGERIYQYDITCTGNAEAGELTVVSPEAISGTGTAWAEGETLLEYEGVSLETGPLSPDGLSPADALPVILSACQSGVILESGLEGGEDEEQILYLLTENPRTNAEESRVALWADPTDGRLLKAEIYWAGERVICLSFTDFAIQTAQEEPAAP